MGFFKDFLKDIVDEATCGAISSMEVNRGLEQLELFQRDIDAFNRWFADHSGSYTDLLDSLNHCHYHVDGKVFHSSWLTGKVETAYSFTSDEINEHDRRKSQIEGALKAQAPGYMKKLFKDYLSETEKSILDSYSAFCTFQNEISYLPDFQKKIIDSA